MQLEQWLMHRNLLRAFLRAEHDGVMRRDRQGVRPTRRDVEYALAVWPSDLTEPLDLDTLYAHGISHGLQMIYGALDPKGVLRRELDKLAQKAQETGNTDKGAEELRDIAQTLVTGYAMYQQHLVPPCFDVEEKLQYLLLTMDPPNDLTWDELVMPAEGFLLAVPYKAFDAVNDALKEKGAPSLLMGTHVAVARAPYLDCDNEPIRIYVVDQCRRSNGQLDTGCYTVLAARHPPRVELDRPAHTVAIEHGVLVRRYVLNFLLMLSMDTTVRTCPVDRQIAAIEAVPKNKRRKVMQERLERLRRTTRDTIVVSTTIDLDLAVRDYVLGGGLTGTGVQLTHRTLVKGHVKWQPYGPRNSLRKRKIIESYMRGPELEGQIAATAHTYRVTSSKAGET